MSTLDTIKNKEQLIHLRISRELLYEFKIMACIEDMSVSSYVRVLIKRELVRKKYVTRHRADRL